MIDAPIIPTDGDWPTRVRESAESVSESITAPVQFLIVKAEGGDRVEITGRCHCGRLSYEVYLPFDGETIPVRRCSCTFCRKHGAVYTSHPQGTLHAVVRGASADAAYTFATGTAEFHVCSNCGVVPFVTSEIEGTLRAVVNVNTFEGVDPGTFVESTSDFDGEDVASRLARRARTWIPTVTVRTRHDG